MISADTWLKVVCSMVINSIIFGIGVTIVLMTPVLSEHAKYTIPVVVLLSFLLSPVLAIYTARRMRIRYWGRENWRRGDAISG